MNGRTTYYNHSCDPVPVYHRSARGKRVDDNEEHQIKTQFYVRIISQVREIQENLYCNIVLL